ncbi:sodium:calcium antiporter [Candidatus Woesearchaeota archaeon]|nr:sodium:calcium antiporter [Candidatus Woesearchaeota archaeon]
MALIAEFLWVIVSGAVVLGAAEFAIQAALRLALRFGMSDELIGMTVLAIGTSIPEIMTHIMGSVTILGDKASYIPLSGLVIGANIGSDIFQQNFLLGLVALLGVLVVARKDLFKDVGGLVGASCLLFIFALDGTVSRAEGAILVFGYIVYLWYLKRYGLVSADEKRSASRTKVVTHPLADAMILIAAFTVMAFAADRMIAHSEVLVDALPLSASFIGVILLGVASAFPELITSILAIVKGRTTVSIGILVGSNITNPMLALGLGALISTYAVPAVVVEYDLPIKIATGIAIFAFLWRGRLRKWQGVLLIALYIAYLFMRMRFFPADIMLV